MAELKRGLEGVIAAETKISSIIDSQLTYAGYDIDDLAENAQFEEIIFYYGIIDFLMKRAK